MNKPPEEFNYMHSPIMLDQKRTLNIISPGENFLFMSRVNSSDALTNVSPFLIKKVVDNKAGGEVLL